MATKKDENWKEQLLEEVEKIRRVPGITFADDADDSRCARIAGTGLEVFEIIMDFQAVGGDRGRLRDLYHWLTKEQLDAALAYAEAYPEEIAKRIKLEDDLEAQYTDKRPGL